MANTAAALNAEHLSMAAASSHSASGAVNEDDAPGPPVDARRPRAILEFVQRVLATTTTTTRLGGRGVV